MSGMALADISPATRVRIAPMTLVMLAVLMGGTALRIAGATGSLWLDEIWSLQNLERLPAGGIVWSISEDNNHFLNSLWLWVTGPDASPLVLRAAAVVFGIGAIVLAMRIAARDFGQCGAVLAGLAFATSYVFIHYGSEARGYAGMIFGLLWAYDALLRFMDAPERDRPRLEFGFAVALGSLSQVTMLPAAGLLVVGATLHVALCTRKARETCGVALKLSSAFVLGAAPVCAAVAAGLLNTHMLKFGDQHAFEMSAWTGGIAGVISATFGIPAFVSPVVIIVLALAAALCAMPLVRRDQRYLALSLIVGLPVAEAMARLPNLHIPRFHLAIAAALLLVFAQTLAALWRRAGMARIAAGAAIVVFLAGNICNIVPFLMLGRGDYAPAVRMMGSATYATNELSGVTRVARFYGEREGVRLVHTPMKTCGDPRPDWFILVEDLGGVATPAPTYDVGPVQCREAYAMRASFSYSGLSGFRWTLYRHPTGS